MTFDQIETTLGQNVVQQLYSDILQIAQKQDAAIDPAGHARAIQELLAAILALLILRYSDGDDTTKEIDKHAERIAELVSLMKQITSRTIDVPFARH